MYAANTSDKYSGLAEMFHNKYQAKIITAVGTSMYTSITEL